MGNSIFKNKNFWIGAGIGAAVGGGITGFVTHSVTKKKERRYAFDEIQKARRKTEQWCSENVIVIDAGSPEEMQSALQKALKERSEGSESDEKSEDSEESSGDHPPVAKNDENSVSGDDLYAEKGTLPVKNEVQEAENPVSEPHFEPKIATIEEKEAFVAKTGDYPWTISGRQYHVQLNDGGILSYPIEIFCDNHGLMDMGTIRTNLRIYEHNLSNLKRVWEALGWGEFVPDPEEGVIYEEEPTNMDVSLEDLAEMEQNSSGESEERTLEKERYYDMVEKYQRDPSVGVPKIVSKRYFDENSTLKHMFVSYYAADNVFTDNEDMNSTIDPSLLYGVVNGKELFDYKISHPFDLDDDDNDPDIVHVMNFADGSISEITRYKRSYQSERDGSAYFDGGSDKI